MQSRFPLALAATLLGAASLSACGTTPAEDLERVTFPARDDFPGLSSVDALSSLSRTYTFDPGLERSHLYVQIFSASLGHDHVVRATDWWGSLAFDPANLSGCAVSVTVQVEGLEPERDEMRDLTGQDRVSQSDRDQIREHLRAKDQLNLEEHKTLEFTSKSCALTGEKGAAGLSRVEVTGELKLRGVTREVKLPLEVAVDEEQVAARGVLTTRHSDFGFEPYSMMGGLFKNKDELYFVVDVRGRRVAGK
ncbi:YceI family protein [Archangium lansingense]|uniref:YceI family protein n=1 Tax=Archangium lansingense TaxID=2995310 RepID=A0ABT3ZZ93_9BACT|nr:YceI family protein [Archangium lansinium]MCY1074359.1 YceI family protein [Archangium lansinium]